MAPRARPRKGLTRMDAALDAMRKYGFKEKSVRTEMKNLLQIYGEDGWPLIEDDSYKVLLDNLLEKSMEEEQQHKDDCLGYGAGDENNGTALEAPLNDALTLDAGPSSEFQSGSNIEAWQIVPSPSTDEPLDSVLENDMTLVNTFMTRISGGSKSFPTDDARLNMSEDMNVDHGDTQVIDVIRGGLDVGDASGVGKAADSLRFRIHSGPSASVFRHAKSRRPCYGWISSDDDDEDEVNIGRLEPEPLPEEVKSMYMEANAKYKRRRWDIGPENL